jgi:hypothetical protein
MKGDVLLLHRAVMEVFSPDVLPGLKRRKTESPQRKKT